MLAFKESTQNEKYFDAVKLDLDQLESKISNSHRLHFDTDMDEISQLLKYEILSRYYFNQGRKAAERLMVLLNDLLDLSKMESVYNICNGGCY